MQTILEEIVPCLNIYIFSFLNITSYSYVCRKFEQNKYLHKWWIKVFKKLLFL